MHDESSPGSPCSNASDSSFSTVSSAAQDGNEAGCSSMFNNLRRRAGNRLGVRCSERAAGVGLKIRTSPYPRLVSRQKDDVKRSRSGLGQLLSPELNRSVARNIFSGENAVDAEASVGKECRREQCDRQVGDVVDNKQETRKSGTLSSTIAEIFRCFICLGKLVDAQLCPCCSKLVCMLCIKRWLTDQKSECPHCRASLLVSQLVSCKFISEITTEVEKIHGNIDEDAPPEKICSMHGSPLAYYCTTCSTPVCSDCAILAENHQNHTFERLSVTYGRHSKKLLIEASTLRTRLNELYNLLASVDKDIEAVLKAKDDQANEIETAFKRMRAKLEEQLKCKLLTLLAQKGTVSQEVELLENILRQLDFQISTSSKSDLIAHEPTMTSIIHDFHKRINTDIRRDPVSADFVSEVVPPFEHGELVLENFNKFSIAKLSDSNDSSDTSDSTNEVVYSAPISATGITWRLKVYPNGSGTSKGSHISAFLEMVRGGSEPTTYEYGIELLHPTQPHQKVVRRFSSDFEEGACWGYYQFFKMEDLRKEGYIVSSEDKLTLNFYVRAQTYLQQCLDLRRSLSACQAERDEAVTQFAVLRRAFASSIWQHRRRKSSSISDLEDEQGSIKHALAGAVSSLLPPGSFEQQLATNSLASRDTVTRLDSSTLPGVGQANTASIKRQKELARKSSPQSLTVDEPSEVPSMKLSKCSANSGSREKCELWLKSRDNMFQIPAGRSKLHRRGSRYRKGNRSSFIPEAVSLSKRTRTETSPDLRHCSIPEESNDSTAPKHEPQQEQRCQQQVLIKEAPFSL